MKKLTTIMLMIFVIIPSAFAVYGGSDADSSSGSSSNPRGSGGGGGSSSIISASITVPSQGITATLYSGRLTILKLGNKEFNIRARASGRNSVHITIGAQATSLVIGQSAIFDGDNDGTDDLSAKLLAINGINIKLSFIPLSQKSPVSSPTITAPKMIKEAEEGEEEREQDEKTPVEEETPSQSLESITGKAVEEAGGFSRNLTLFVTLIGLLIVSLAFYKKYKSRPNNHAPKSNNTTDQDGMWDFLDNKK